MESKKIWFTAPLCFSIIFNANVSADDRQSQATAVSFAKIVLTDKYYCDGIAAGDINGDGNQDIVAGPFWYEGPDFTKPHAFYPPKILPTEVSPSNSMFSFLRDFDGDGRLDILVLGRVHRHEAFWYKNPGDSFDFWKRHFVFERVRGESPQLANLLNQSTQLLTHHDGKWGWLEPHQVEPRRPWRFVPVGENEGWPQFYHGQGVGDINGDGRQDMVINDGWYEQPTDPYQNWEFHRVRFSQDRGGAQMYVYDVDGDGDNDVVTSLHAHEWGMAWFERLGEGASIRFREHKFMGDRSEEEKFGVAFSQPHALAIGDMDGDGLTDVICGKRRWAHGPNGDVEPNAAPVVYWFQLKRTSDGSVQFIPHLIDSDSGVGVQIAVDDVNNDGRLDVLTASKLGSFVFLNQKNE